MITVMLVDDQELIRIGLKAVLSHDPEIKVVADLDTDKPWLVTASGHSSMCRQLTNSDVISPAVARRSG